MKGFLIFLAIGLATCDKLDRTYLPPPGAKFSGGNAGDIQTPFELPKEAYPSGTLIADNGLSILGNSRNAVRTGPAFAERPTKAFNNFGDRIPTATTSYAFSQTTTLPPIESYSTTGVPLNPSTGFPLQYSSRNPINYGYAATFDNIGQPGLLPNLNIPSISEIVQPGLETQGHTVNFSGPNLGPNIIQPQGQYQTNIPGSIQASPFSQSSLNQDQGFTDYLDKVNSLPSAEIPQETSGYSTGSNQYGPNFDGTQTVFAGTRNIPEDQNLDSTFSKKGNFNLPAYGPNQQEISAQQYPGNVRGPFVDSVYQPGSTSTTIAFLSGISSSTPVPSVFSSTLRARPQADNDKNAEIINFENVRSPNGYSYSYDTSNGIHANESGTIDNGTKARGGYSYTGDDGKIYSITYTADENGFQPRGDHLPTPPPIPEAIQKVIEQAFRDKEAGISDDGSYDEAKYGDNTFYGYKNRLSPKMRHNTFEDYEGVLQDKQNQRMFQTNKQVVSNRDRYTPQKISAESNNYRNDQRLQSTIPSQDSANNGQNNFDKNNNPIYDSNKEKKLVRHPISRMRTTDVPVGYPNVPDFNTNREQKGNNDLILSTKPDNESNIDTFTDKRRPNTYRHPGVSTYGQQQEAIPKSPEVIFTKKTAFDTFNNNHSDAPQISLDRVQATQPMTTLELGNNNYNGPDNQYLPPQSTFEQNQYPSRFGTKDISTTVSPILESTGSTAKPFIYENNDIKQESTFPIKLTSPAFTQITTESVYPGYIDYPENNESDRIRTSSTRVPVGNNGSTSRPNQEIQTSSRPYNYSPSYDRKLANQNQTPGSKIPDYKIKSTTAMPTYNSPLRTSQSNGNLAISGYRPLSSTEIPDAASKINNPTSSNDFGALRPNFLSESPPNDGLIFGARLPNSSRTGNRYPSSTLQPSSEYATVSPSANFNPSSLPSESSANTYDAYYYGPGISPSGYPTAPKGRPGLSIPSGPGMYSQVPPGSTYQSGYQYGPVPDLARPGVVPSNVPNFPQSEEVERSPNFQTGFGPADFPSSSPRPGLVTVSYPKDNQGSGLIVDNFGRPIYNEQAPYPAFSTPQDTGIPSNQDRDIISAFPGQTSNASDDLGIVPNYDASTPGSYGSTKIIGEEFSGPKQPQRFDSKSGYHY